MTNLRGKCQYLLKEDGKIDIPKKKKGVLIFETNKEFREKSKSFFGTRNANQRFQYEETLCLLQSTHTPILVIC